ncbi:cation transporter [Rhizobium yanglingense]|nr:cation transporter [Rhizobium yanglingense]
MTTQVPARGFTGRHMLLVMVTFFGVVISVNFTMAWYASSTWSGLVVENTYVASQQFNNKAAAMKAMAASGIAGTLSFSADAIHYDIRKKDGSPAAVDEVALNLKRPVGDHEDFQLAAEKIGEGQFEARHVVPEGDWIVEITSRHGGTMVMHEARRIDTTEFGK